MQSALFIAKIIGPIYVVFGVGLVLNPKIYQRVIQEFLNAYAIRYLAGFLALVFGLLIVQVHNVWEFHWAVVITIMGWMGIIKGVLLTVFPDTMTRLSERYTRSTHLLTVQSVGICILGLFLTIMGYWG